MKVLIDNNGCDDTTRTIMDLKQEELDFMIRFAKENNKNSRYQCQPSIEIYKDFEEIIDEDGDKYIRTNGKDILLED